MYLLDHISADLANVINGTIWEQASKRDFHVPLYSAKKADPPQKAPQYSTDISTLLVDAPSKGAEEPTGKAKLYA